MKKILILMARFGGGHESIAKAIKDAIETYGVNQFEVVIEDVFPKIFLISENYSTLLPIFKESYHVSDNEKVAKIINMSISLLVRRHLKKLIKKHNPDLVISDYTMTNYAIKKAISSFKKNILFAVYFADATYLHQLWLTEKEADLYFSPTKDCIKIAVDNGIPEERIYCTGWILRKEFYGTQPENHYKKNLGFDENKKLIYLSGGGDGYGKIEEIVDEFLNNQFFLKNCQLVIICGVNHKLLVKMQKLQRKHMDHIFSFGFIQNVFDFKKASDAICSKAGPNDIFESILLEKPFFAHDYLWGHEEDNFNWVKRQGIGFSERDPRKMVNKIIRVLKKPELMEEKIANVKKLREEHLNAPRILVEKIREILTNTN
jgi:UDP-N-acetylglucosamine:LPS N-acetylglucosamine transferase